MHFQEFKRSPSPRMGSAQKPSVFRLTTVDSYVTVGSYGLT